MAKRSVAEVATGVAVLVVTAGFLGYALTNTGHGAANGMTLSARFENVGALAAGADVRLSGVPVGRVIGTTIDPQSFQAVVRFAIQPGLKLPTDSGATISTGGLLGAPFLTLTPGGAEAELKEGSTITITQSATNLEDLLGKFIFNVGSLADATQKSLREKGQDPASGPAGREAVTAWRMADGTPVSCREKVKTLDENQAEVRQVLQDAFEDAVLMGVDEGAMRAIMADTVAALQSPRRRS